MSEQRRHLRMLLWLGFAALLVLVLLVHPVYAATSEPVGGRTVNFSLFDSLDAGAYNQSRGWFNTIQGLMRPTFLALGTLEICWAAAIWALEKDNLNSLAVEIIKKIMFIGFFYALLQYASDWIPSITNTFQQVGETAAAEPNPITTDSIIATGLAVIDFVWSKVPGVTLINIWGLIPKFIVAAFVSVGVIIAYVIIAAQYFTLRVESYVLFAAGAIFLGLGSSSWTKEYTSKYLNYAINVGIRLLVLILVVSLMQGALQQMGATFTFDYKPLLEVMAVCILQGILGIKAPELAGALMNGGVGLSAGGARGAVGSAMGAAVSTVGMATGAVGAMAGTAVRGAQGLASLGKAVNAGSQLAQQQGKSGAAAKLSGLGMAVGQVARQLPGSMMNVIKGRSGSHNHSGGGSSQNSGPLARASQNLQKRLGEMTPTTSAPASGSGAGRAAEAAAATLAGAEAMAINSSTSDVSSSSPVGTSDVAVPTQTSPVPASPPLASTDSSSAVRASEASAARPVKKLRKAAPPPSARAPKTT